MIENRDIERKDFSLPFHNIISKVSAISQALFAESERPDDPPELAVAG